MSVMLVPDTPETRRKMQELARHQMLVRLEADILIDLQVCGIEGWSKTEYLDMLGNMISRLRNGPAEVRQE